MSLLIKNVSQIVQVVSDGRKYITRDGFKNLAVIGQDDREEKLCIAVDNGLIKMFGPESEITSSLNGQHFDTVYDANGGCVIPGLIDGHTHPVWAGDRVHEFAMKLAGATYMEVHEAGGGINYTVEHTKKASEEELYTLLADRITRMIKSGTTTAECKSGYGLDTHNEIKMLRVLEKAKKNLPMEISSTFCGAHSVPKGMSSDEATKDVIENQIPEVVKLNKTGELGVENIDVFCEKGVFNVEQTKSILKAGQDQGKFRINFHGEELNYLGSVEMGAEELKAEAISHLEEISDEGINAMAKNGSVAVILPTTAYILRLNPPRVRKMIDNGVIVALGTDFNPNAFCLSMPTVMHLAAVNLRMSLNETLAASTINAAHSIGRSETHGSIEVGKIADLVILKSQRWEHIVYQFAGYDHVINAVIKRGKVVYEKQNTMP